MKCIAVTSGKGGTGKSCVAGYTGAALAAKGHKTLLLELGANFLSLDLVVGVKDQAVFDITDVLEGRCEPESAVVYSGIQENLFLMPAGLNPPEAVQPEAYTKLLDELAKEYEFIILDGVDFSVFPVSYPDMVLLVLTPDSLSIRAGAKHAQQLHEQGVKQLRLVINNVPSEIVPMYGARDFDDIIDMVGVQLIAVVPHSPKLQYSSNNAQPLDEESLTVKVFDHLAGRLLGKRLPLLIL